MRNLQISKGSNEISSKHVNRDHNFDFQPSTLAFPRLENDFQLDRGSPVEGLRRHDTRRHRLLSFPKTPCSISEAPSVTFG